jgi:hypothetical protein
MEPVEVVEGDEVGFEDAGVLESEKTSSPSETDPIISPLPES